MSFHFFILFFANIESSNGQLLRHSSPYIYYFTRQSTKIAGKVSSQSASSPSTNTSFLDPKGEEFAKLKERILLLERVILHTIGFELSIDHPYKFLVEQIKKLTHTRQLEYITPPANTSTSQVMSKMLNELVQYSMNFANDSVHTSLCLQFSPQLIATSCVYLAGHFAKVRPSNNKGWLEVLGYHDSDAEALSSICVQVIELIVDRRGSDVKAFQTIRAELEKLKDAAGGSSPPPPSSPANRPPPPTSKPPPPSPGPGESPAKRQRTS